MGLLLEPLRKQCADQIMPQNELSSHPEISQTPSVYAATS